MPEPRCLACGYILTGLETPQCPECGRPFAWSDPGSFSTKPLFERWRYWLPGFLLALGVGAVLFPLLIYLTGFRWTVILILPVCLGAIIGYGCRVKLFVQILFGLIALAGLIFGLGSVNIVGVFCGIVLGLMALGPLLIGVLLGFILRWRLKKSAWDQRWYLPMLLLLVAPLLCGLIEARFERPYADETVTTSVLLPVSDDRAWKTIMVYEDVRGPIPLLMRFALPRPLYTRGSMENVGDTKVCVYSKGRLVKRITERVQGRMLGFDVIEQTKIENRSIVLKTGTLQFARVGPDETRVTLSTTYEPLLGPRWAWRWSERLGMHTLHEHVLEGMRRKAAEDAGRPGSCR